LSNDDDPATRATALAALFARGLAPARHDDDPWIRGALLGSDTAIDVLRGDPHPPLRRAAFVKAARAGRALEAARIASEADDPWLRLRAAERLARSSEPEDEERAYRLLFDADPAVRAAAADAPRRSAALRARLASRAAEIMASPSDEATRHAEPTPRVARVASPRALGKSGLVVSPLAISGAHEPSIASLFAAASAGCNLFFWEPRYRSMTTFLRAAAERGAPPLVVAGSYHATERAILADIARARKRLGRDRIDVFLIFWTRSAARLEGEVPRALARAKSLGHIGAAGFSTHDRGLAERAIAGGAWDVIMVRHSAAHPGAEESLFASAAAANVGVLAFSATSYGRLLGGASAAECYRYSLGQPGVSACVSAPRGGVELMENLAVLEEPTLAPARLEELRAHGRAVRAESLDFARHIRRFPAALDEALDDVDAEGLFTDPAFL
jgi:aryl-alcohol dehydrogenase-like predicted oxidoreductase